MAALIGSMIGPYEIHARLGAGGMGEVFLGHDTRLQRRVALKCLTTPETEMGDVRARVLREARAAARLNHPHIAAVYDVLEQDSRTFIVMEYVAGESLAARLEHGRLGLDQGREIGRQLASALAAAHAQGVIHRDLKPANILVGRDGSIKVLDFGVAKLSSSIATSTSAATESGAPTEVTLAGNPGTPIYMSPEQLFNKEIDVRSDIYSAGVILFEIATGRRPYLANGIVGLALAMTAGPPPAAAAINPDIPADLNDAIARAIEHEPAARFQSARALESALAGTRGLATDATMSRFRLRTSRRKQMWMSAAAIAALLAMGGVSLRPVLTRLGLRRPTTTATRPTVLAILPVDNPTGDPQTEYLGAGIASVIAENFGSIPGLTVLSRASTASYQQKRNDLEALRKDLGADYILDLSMRTTAQGPQLVARLRRPGPPSPDWERTLSGDALVIEKTLLDGLGQTLEARGAFSRRLTGADWTRIRKLPTTNGDALMAYSEARALLDRPGVRGNGARAAALLERVVSQDPAFAWAYAALGDAYWDSYQTDQDPSLVAKATDAVMQAIRIDPDQGAVYYSLGNMQYLTGRPEDAANSLRRSLTLQPDGDETHRLLGQVLADRGDVDAGVAEVQQAIRIRPQYWRHYMTLGLIYYRAARYRDALVPYRRATELQPTEASPFANLGTTYHRLGDTEQAIGYYEHAVRLAPSGSAYSNLAFAYYGVKRYDDAVKAYQQSLAANPKSVLNHRNLGDVYQRVGQPARARAEYEQAIAIGNDLVKVNARDYRTIAQIALCEAKLGRTASAGGHAAEARALGPTDRETLQRTAEVYARLGNTAAAMKDLEAAIAAGYAREEARENEELAALRKLPAYLTLVADRP